MSFDTIQWVIYTVSPICFGAYGSRQLAILGYQNITFDGFIFTLCSFNITCDNSFVTFGGSFIFFSHLMISFSHCAILTSHVTIFLSHSGVHYFFFLTFDSFILILCSSNIICDSSFVTFDGLLIFSHI